MLKSERKNKLAELYDEVCSAFLQINGELDRIELECNDDSTKEQLHSFLDRLNDLRSHSIFEDLTWNIIEMQEFFDCNPLKREAREVRERILSLTEELNWQIIPLDNEVKCV